MAPDPKNAAKSAATPLPDDLRGHLESRVDSFHGPRLVELFAQTRGLPARSNLKLKFVRDRIKEDCRTAENLHRYGFLAEGFPPYDFIAAVDGPSRAAVVNDLSILFTQDPVTLCLLFLDDPKGRGLGLDRLRSMSAEPEDDIPDGETADAFRRLETNFKDNPFWRRAAVAAFRLLDEAFDPALRREIAETIHIDEDECDDGDAPDGEGAAPDPAAAELIEALSQKCESLRAENAQLRAAERESRQRSREAEKNEKKLKAAQDRIAALERTRQEQDAELRARRDECARLSGQLERARKDEDDRVRLGVQAAMAAEYGGWLAYARRFEEESAAAASRADDLAARVEAALDRQADLDRHSGNRRELSRRLDALRALRDRSRSALDDAMRPSPQLHALLRETEAEIERISSLLNPGVRAEKSDLERGLDDLVDGAAPSATLDSVAAAAESLLSKEAGKRVRDHIAQVRRSAVFDDADLRALVDSVPLEHKDDLDPCERFRLAFNGGSPTLLLVDGHNVLGCYLKGRYAPLRPGQPNTDIRGRTMLADDVAHRFRPRPWIQVQLFYDGPLANAVDHCENVVVRYSGGEGEHRADNAILDAVRALRERADATTDAAVPIFVVSNDKDLARQASRLGALPLPVNFFGDLLG